MQLFKTISLLLIPLSLISQSVPLAFNFQGIARDNQGNVYANQEISLEISLVRNFESGPVDFIEEHFVQTNEFGLFNLQVGLGDPILGNMDALDWDESQYYIHVGFDPKGGRDFVNLGTSQLLSVPYAMHARTVSGADGSTDDQLIDLQGTVLTIEDGNSVDLAGIIGSGGEDNQTLSLSGTILTIEDGNSVNLASVQDGVEDADSDPANELQSLSVNGDQLTISNGNTISLPPGGGGNSPWMIDGDEITYDQGPVNMSPSFSLLNNDGTSVIHGSLSAGTGRLQVFDQFSTELMHFGPSAQGNGFLRLNNASGGENVRLTHDLDGGGFFSLYNDNGQSILSLSTAASGSGLLSLQNQSGSRLISMQRSTGGSGYIDALGPNGNLNAAVSSLSTNLDHGFITVYDANGDNQAGIYVNEDGQGVVFADITATAIPDSDRGDRQMMYASMAGPEVGVYVRGTASLVNGRATVVLPNHFKQVFDKESMTVSLTPLSLDSKGLSVFEKNDHGFQVGELHSGNGSYSFDWEVKCVRKGFDEFQPIQEIRIAEPEPESSN